MTAAVDFKVCQNPACGRPFFRSPRSGLGRWGARRYCSTTCGVAVAEASDMSWQARAACRDVDPELFFPVGTGGASFDGQVAEAKAVCARCPVRGDCLSWALAGLEFGIAGGATPEERRRINAVLSGAAS